MTITDYTGTEIRQNFFSMLTMAKIFKKLFAPTLYGIAAGVQHASFTPRVEQSVCVATHE